MKEKQTRKVLLFGTYIVVIALLMSGCKTQEPTIKPEAVAIKVKSQIIVPVPFPDPGIPGFKFPTPENTILGWVSSDDQTAINRHAWGLWTGLTMETDQVFEGQKLRVFETWFTPEDIISGSRPTPRLLQKLRQLTHGDAATHGEETVKGFVKYDPTASKHIVKYNLFDTLTLDRMLKQGAGKIPDFPDTAIVLKPVFQTIAQKKLVDGRYYKMAAWPEPPWPGPPGVLPPVPPSPDGFPKKKWGQCIWIDLLNQGMGSGTVDTVCDSTGSSRTPQNTYNVSSFINFRLKAEGAKLLNISKKPSSNILAEGDYAVLQGMHVTSREITRWTWQTFWWTPNPDNPHFPSSRTIAAERPSQLKGAAANYAHAPAYSMVYPAQPDSGGKNEGNSVYAYNPWLEARFDTTVLWDSEPGMYNGNPVLNNVGIQTNCMSCHALANYNRWKLTKLPDYTGDRYIDLGSTQFDSTLQVDFLWSIPDNAN